MHISISLFWINNHLSFADSEECRIKKDDYFSKISCSKTWAKYESSIEMSYTGEIVPVYFFICSNILALVNFGAGYVSKGMNQVWKDVFRVSGQGICI